ncbi:MAG TPA: HD domain-containing phosphohydrolase [Gemmatimonadales bacterium]|nr:HD domain-containing phosphohydrolase [Gemmatimonadales bacterium]
MPSPGSARLRDARALERAGQVAAAMTQYQGAITEAERHGEGAALAEALRRLAVLYHQQGDTEAARPLCTRSREVASGMGDRLLTAEALNTIGAMEMMNGSLPDAAGHFRSALELGAANRGLCARVEQNLGILANIRGDLEEACSRYERSLAAYRDVGDEHGCALAYHNLGMVSADREQWDEAIAYFAKSRAIAEREGDRHLQGLCLLNQAADVYLARQRYEEARTNAEAALSIFHQLGARSEKSGAYRVIGVVYRETGRAALGEARLRSSIDLALETGSVMNEAEARRELAVLCQMMGRNQEALSLLNAAHRLFRRLDARRDLVRVDDKVADLERTYLAVVREWGQSIESNDSYTFGHCERVARNAVTLARALGLDYEQQTTIRLGAYLHDVGKVSIPHEILNKAGPLTREEFALVQQHPVRGVELLASVELPWDLKPIVRWHHEKFDGTGYPDRLRGDEIPLSAQIVGIVDVYDALTSARPYRPALPPARAVEELSAMNGAWSTLVFLTFLGVLPELSRARNPQETGTLVQPNPTPRTEL